MKVVDARPRSYGLLGLILGHIRKFSNLTHVLDMQIFWNIDSNRRKVVWSTLCLRKNRINPNKLRLLKVNLCDPMSMSLFLRSSLRTFEGSRDGFGSSAILSQKYFFRCFPQSPHDFKTTPRPDLLH